MKKPDLIITAPNARSDRRRNAEIPNPLKTRTQSRNLMPNKPSISRAEQKALLKLSPFEQKDKLISLAQAGTQRGTAQFLNAGRGNPNWICTTPREAFATLLRFAIEESKRALDAPDLGGMPEKAGIAERFTAFLDRNKDAGGTKLLRKAVTYGVNQLKFNGDAFVHELTDGITGDMYPGPVRMLVCAERIVQEYLDQEMCEGRAPKGKYDLFAVEGGTAAMCYIFDSLMQNQLLHRGDRIALAVPTFTPYIEIPHFHRYEFKVTNIDASRETRPDGTHSWQYGDEEIDKLADKRIKALFLVNPSNPPSYAMRAESRKRLVKLVKTKRPDLIIITDDVYGTFVPGFRSVMAELPQNTIGVYSFSKHFGATGWRLGVIAIHEDHICDRMLSKLPAKDRTMLNRRYSSLTLVPEKLKFIDRMVADSRQVALNHTAGLSAPQQIQMTLFALFALLDTTNSYKTLCQLIVRRRNKAMWEGLDLPEPPAADRAGYYAELDIMVWAERTYGPEFVRFLRQNYEATDILFRLAEQSGVVLLPGGGFGGPEWSVRVSLANLPEKAYGKIGEYLRKAAEEYVPEWRSAQKKKGR
jgi:aspartate 4-decarboxylase